MSTISIAAVAAPFGRDLEGCFARVERLVAAARGLKVRLLGLPEACLGGYLSTLDGTYPPMDRREALTSVRPPGNASPGLRAYPRAADSFGTAASLDQGRGWAADRAGAAVSSRSSSVGGGRAGAGVGTPWP